MRTQILAFDEEATKRLGAVYTSKEVVDQRREVISLLDLKPGERVIDIGSGPGYLATEIAQGLGLGGEVLGVDISESMLAFSRSHAKELGVEGRVDFLDGDAVRLPVPDESFDVAVTTQVFEYVEDVDKALDEIYRVLRPSGRTLILDTDWDSLVWHSSDPQAASRILAEWAHHLIDPHLPRTLNRRLAAAGFEMKGPPRAITIVNTDFREDTYSWGLAGLISEFVRGRGAIAPPEIEDWLQDLRKLDERGDYFLSINRYAFLASKP